MGKGGERIARAHGRFWAGTWNQARTARGAGWLRVALHQDKSSDEAGTAAFQLLHGASSYLREYLKTHENVHAPPRLTPLTPPVGKVTGVSS